MFAEKLQLAGLDVDKNAIQKMESGYETIIGEWNAETAALRICGLCGRLGFLEQQDMTGVAAREWENLLKRPESGPCSPAPVIGERKMYDLITAKGEKR